MAARKGGKPKAGSTETVKSPGKPPIKFKAGGLHESTGTPAGQKIPPAKMQAALSGKLGPKAEKQAVMAQGVLAKGRRTAAKNRKSA